MKKKKLLLLICGLAAAPAAAAHDIVTSRYSYLEHVLPILQAHCVRCHCPDGPAPFRLTSYLDARPRAVAIKEEILLRNMPPWFAEAGQHKLIGEDRLSAAELDILVEWASGGAPEGKRSPEGNALAKIKPPEIADLELELPVMVLAPGSRRKTLTLELRTGLEETAWITGWDLSTAKVDLLRSASLYRGGIAAVNYLGTRMSIDEKLSFSAGAEIEAGRELTLSVIYSRPWRLGNKKGSVRGKLRLWLSMSKPSRLLHARQLNEVEGLPPGASLLGVHPSTPLRLRAAGRPGSLIDIFAAPARWPIFYRFSEPIDISGRLEAGPGNRGTILYTAP